jgi:hypothetical protein
MPSAEITYYLSGLIHLEMDQTEFLYQASERVYITASGWETEFSETMGLYAAAACGL